MRNAVRFLGLAIAAVLVTSNGALAAGVHLVCSQVSCTHDGMDCTSAPSPDLHILVDVADGYVLYESPRTEKFPAVVSPGVITWTVVQQTHNDTVRLYRDTLEMDTDVKFYAADPVKIRAACSKTTNQL